MEDEQKSCCISAKDLEKVNDVKEKGHLELQDISLELLSSFGWDHPLEFAMHLADKGVWEETHCFSTCEHYDDICLYHPADLSFIWKEKLTVDEKCNHLDVFCAIVRDKQKGGVN